MDAIIIGLLVIIGIVSSILFGAYLGREAEREEREKTEFKERIDRLEQKVFGEDSDAEENEEKAE